MKLKTYRVHFEISGHSYRDVEAFDEIDAREQVQNDRIYMDDLEDSELGSIDVDEIEEIKVKKRK